MPSLLPLTALVITYNEEANIKRTLDSLQWIYKVIVLDSGSVDSTINIASDYTNVSIFYRKFDTFAKQCNYGLKSLVSTPWVLSIDADYCVSNLLKDEITNLFTSQTTLNRYIGFQCEFVYCIGGYPLRATLLPPRVCLYRVDSAYYKDEGHGHRLVTTGKVGKLAGYILHDDRKSLSRWLVSQQKYMQNEANTLLSSSTPDLSLADKIRKNTILAPLLVFVYVYILKLGFLDGLPGFTYALQRVYAEILLLLFITDSKCKQMLNGSFHLKRVK